MTKNIKKTFGFILALVFISFFFWEISKIENPYVLSWRLVIYSMGVIFFSTLLVFGILSTIPIKYQSKKGYPLTTAISFFLFMAMAALLWLFTEARVFFVAMFVAWLVVTLIAYWQNRKKERMRELD
jgi:hypothetical protein